MKKLHLKSKKIERAKKNFEAARLKFLSSVEEVQLECLHPETAFANYVPCPYGGVSLKPMGICLHCGAVEVGWNRKIISSGEVELQIPREEVYRLRTGKQFEEHEVSDILRVKTTYTEAIEEYFDNLRGDR